MLPYTIDDPIRDPLNASIEVTIDFGGHKRWLLFVTPQLLASDGDWVEGTGVRVHLGERHMIVASELTETVIDQVLQYLDAIGELEGRSLPMGSEDA
jgi:hypothetical protein